MTIEGMGLIGLESASHITNLVAIFSEAPVACTSNVKQLTIQKSVIEDDMHDCYDPATETLQSISSSATATTEIRAKFKCTLCLNATTNPKFLKCSHAFCQDCLAKRVQTDQNEKNFLTCPECHQNILLPDEGIECLPVDPINYVFEVLDKVKTVSISRATESADSYCYEHVDEKLALYCKLCETCVCPKCTYYGEVHFNHTTFPIHEAHEKCDGELSKTIEFLKKQLKSFSLVESQEIVYYEHGVAEAEIDSSFRTVQKVLDTRKTELVEQVRLITHAKQQASITGQREQLDNIHKKLVEFLEFVEESMETSSKYEGLTIKSILQKRLNNLVTELSSSSVFSVSLDIISLCQNYGRVAEKGALDVSQCYASGKALEMAVVGEEWCVNLNTICIDGKPYEKPIKLLECELVSVIFNTIVKCDVKRRGKDQYEITYRPTTKGRHLLYIKIAGENIKGSPYVVAVRSALADSESIYSIGDLGMPDGVALKQNGEIFVTDKQNNCIFKFNSNGKKVRSYPGNCPSQIAVNQDGKILVSDCYHRIHLIHPDNGRVVKTVGSRGTGPTQFYFPSGIAFNPRNLKLYIVDKCHRVQVFNSDLTYFTSFGKEGHNLGEFSSPNGIACDSNGRVYVSDSGNYRIQVFTASGEYLLSFGREGVNDGEFELPMGIAIDSRDMVYISDYGKNCVYVFTSTGQFVKAIRDRLSHPRGIAVDDSGVVFICNSGNGCIQLF